MKKSLLLVFLFAALFASCDKNESWSLEKRPIYVEILVFSETGENLLDENAVDCILNKEISVTYNGENYPLSEYSEDYEFFISSFDLPTIIVGPLNGESIQTYSLDLHLGKADYTIEVDNYTEKDKNSKTGYTYFRKFYLNGELVYGPTDSNGGIIKIVLNPADI